MSKSKALLFDLSGSISFGRLSLLGKVLFPMLLLKSDDQGRGLAEPDAIKWKVCPNVAELTPEAIGDVLQEMADERIDLLHLYKDSRGRRLYQFKRWWVPDLGSGSCLQWARPSEYEAPKGWVDRVRLQRGPGRSPLVENWDKAGGFMADELPNDIPTELPNSLPDEGHGGQKNLKEDNLNEDTPTGGADAPAPDPPRKKPRRKKDPPKQPTEHQAVFRALVDGFKLDIRLLTKDQRGRLNALSKRIRGAEYTAADVGAAFTYWYASDWRGQKGQAPANDGQFMATLSKAKKEREDGTYRGNSRARQKQVSIQGHIPKAATPDEFYGAPEAGPG